LLATIHPPDNDLGSRQRMSELDRAMDRLRGEDQLRNGAILACVLAYGLIGLPVAAEPDCLRIAIDPGTVRGNAAADVMKALYAEAGLCVAILDIPNKRIVSMIEAHLIDGEGARVSDHIAATPGLIAIPTPMSEVTGRLYWPKSQTRPQGLDRKIGYIRGYTWPQATAAGLTLGTVEVADQMSLTKMALAGRIDGFLMSDAEFARMPDGSSQAFESAPVRSLSIYHSVTTDHAALVPRLDRAMQKLRADGTLDRLYISTLPMPANK
jgi:hypothetical protein